MSTSSVVKRAKNAFLEFQSYGEKSVVTPILLQTSVFVFIVFVVKYLWERRWLYYHGWKADGPFAWPVIGNALTFLGGDILDKLMHVTGDFKPPSRIWLGGRLIYGVSEPRHLEVVMTEALDKDQLYDFTRNLLGNGLLTAPGAVWKVHRKLIQPTFNQKILNSFVETFAEHAHILVDKLEAKSGKGIFDVFPSFGRYSLDLIIETAIGHRNTKGDDENSFMVTSVEKSIELVNMRLLKVWYHPDFTWNLTPQAKEMATYVDFMKVFTKNIVMEKKAKYRQMKALEHDVKKVDSEFTKERKAFLDYLIELSESGQNWTDDELMEEAVTIVVAGQDTTATTDSFALIMLGMHPEIQAKVHQEVDEVFGSSSRSCTVEDLPKLKYLEMVLKETMRLFPAGAIVGRSVTKNIELDTLTIPKGSGAALVILHTHRNPNLWPDPLKFDPDRFLPDETVKRHPYAYLPFGAGPRNCIGFKYAMMSMKVVVSTVMRHFKVTTDFRRVEDIKFKFEMMLKAANGFRVGLECRSKH